VLSKKREAIDVIPAKKDMLGELNMCADRTTVTND